ncbi:endolytic transglycosylase MltG [Microbacterium sp. SLBN-146]|uniref:endolytic transglycosylase MltG n=1 Tax=Microbacterium sp. SLBN-146 TaxID=2768457 RepID=UPI00115050C6|nr:endolytic transglycosylase MltG [Microbacterium sp. SLBN-146]TQJ32178.1 UPF0755 protein [Microbacterium sp. SLBN-146]
MPDSPSEDPFADLFSKLPDPRSRTVSSDEPGSGSAQDSGQVTPPLSRRAAREAAARDAVTDDAPVADQAPPVSAPVSADRPGNAYTASSSLPNSADDRAIPGYARSSGTAAASSPPPPPQPVPAARPADTAADAAAGPAPAPAPVTSDARAATQEAPARRSGQPVSAPGLEDLFAGKSTTDELGIVPRPVDKRRRRIGGWIAFGVVLAIFGGIAAGGWYVWSTYEPQIRAFMGWEEPKDFDAGLANGEALLTIVSGDTGASISPKLFEAGITKTDDAFYDYLVTEGLNPPFVPGVFRLQLQMTSEAALEAILNPENKLENTSQLREGLTVEQSLPILADTIGIPLEEFQAAVADPSAYGVAASDLEGWLFPATYQFDPGVTATDVISTLVNRTVQSLDAAGVPAEERQRILTIASIIQREARFEADMQKVSTVIVNRLDPGNQETFGYLQMDSTAQYGYGEMHDGTASSSQEALDDDNLWNTYKYPGLPVGPISNPGDTAISAAMNPAEGDWLYFVTVNLDTGETVFTSNLADHNRAVDQWISWCRDNPDSGC